MDHAPGRLRNGSDRGAKRVRPCPGFRLRWREQRKTAARKRTEPKKPLSLRERDAPKAGVPIHKNKEDETENRISRRIQPRRRRPLGDPRAGRLHGLRDHAPRGDSRTLPRRGGGDHEQGVHAPRYARTAAPPAADLRGGDGHEPHRPRGRRRTGHRRAQRRGVLDPLGDRNHDRRGDRPAAPDGLLRPLREERIRRIAAAIPFRTHDPATVRIALGYRRAGKHRPQRGAGGPRAG